VSDRDLPIRDFFQKKGDLTSKASARMRRIDCRAECLLVRVKLACGLTEAKGGL
jgi:hypothetical protein